MKFSNPSIWAFLAVIWTCHNANAQFLCDGFCVYYDVRHLSRIEGHPELGDWEEVNNDCIPLDLGRNFSLTADGAVSSKFEVTRMFVSNCIYDRIDPMVEFATLNFEPIPNPDPDIYGEIMVTHMSSTEIYFEYRHPVELPPEDSLKRSFFITIKDRNPNSGPHEAACWMIVNVYREPVLMVHGLWSEASAFLSMQSALTAGFLPEPLTLTVGYPTTHAASFSINSDVVPSGIDFLVQQSRASKFSVGKVNLVGHSMGGLLSRQYLQSSYRQDVHRLITCNTPHAGSQWGNFLFDPTWSPANELNRQINDTLGFKTYFGALEDLAVGSSAISALNAGGHPSEVGVHAVVTTEVTPTPSLLDAYIMTWSEFQAILIYLSTNCFDQFLTALFNNDEHDLVVAKASQQGGLSGDQFTIVVDQMHVGSTDNPGVIAVVKDLLNAPENSDKFSTSGYSQDASVMYNPSIACDPFFTNAANAGSRSATSLYFENPALFDSTWTSGDTVDIEVSAVGMDTLVMVVRAGPELVYTQKVAGPTAIFQVPLHEEAEGPTPVVIFGYSGTQGLIDFIADDLVVIPAYNLTGISVWPERVCLAEGDTAQLTIIGHCDDGIDRLLNGDPDLQFTFTTWNALRTNEDDIMLLYPGDDTLVVQVDSFTSAMVEISHIFSSSGPVNWIGGIGDWMDGDNWDTGCPPGPESSVYIQSGQCTIPALADVQVGSIEVNQAVLINHGNLAISRSGITALKVDRAVLVNHGLLAIGDVEHTALWLNGTSADSAFVYNHGEMYFESCSNTYGIYVSTRSLLWNDTGAVISVLNCGQFSAIDISSGISGFSLDNQGEIMVSGSPVSGVGRIRNGGNMEIMHPVSAPAGGLSCSFFHNQPSGELTISNVIYAGIDMNYTTDSLINEGTIVIDSSDFVGMFVANTINSGYLEIQHVPQRAIYLEGNYFAFENLSGGHVRLHHADKGVYTRNTGCHFDNHGWIEIDSVNIAFESRFNSQINNFNSGEIDISNCTSHGIYVLENTNTKFNNYGMIRVNAVDGNGIWADANGVFTNFSDGVIILEDIGLSGLRTSGSIFQTSTIITNKGRIEARLPIGQYGLDQGRRFTNDTCGVFVSEKPVRGAAANFNNLGFMHLLSTVPHTFTGSNKITNSGLIEDFHGQLNTATQVTNTGMVAVPKTYSGCTQDTLPGFFVVGNLAGFSVSEGFADPALTTIAGSFDSISNEFVPNDQGVVSPVWYFEIEKLSGGCVDTIAVKATPVCPVTCANDPVYWTGCQDQDWGQPANWNTGVVPGLPDGVTINGIPAGGFFPEIFSSTSIHQLLMKPGAQLTVKNGAVLSIEE